ncbi:hypothetical protein POM88_034689 [Heracleum sosnowskyi]|uniref:Uncharacterized protein n=1 Tax=Heracleum sosnowskyi TaxID=360622 RepID=A0AAD8MD80_9APIA|nr:hypothetical protein POM88_034689 [Heracleum sosnowskyi]
MPPNISYTKFSPSGKVAYAITNGVALMEKESVHEDFHPLMDFLKTSPVSYALTASPPIYAEIVQETWSTADCSSTRGGINLAIKGKSYIITPSVINEAFHFPESNFENTPTQKAFMQYCRGGDTTAWSHCSNANSLPIFNTEKHSWILSVSQSL